jgi:hypothetical protein
LSSAGLQTGITLSSRKWPLRQFGPGPGSRRIATSKPSSVSSAAFDVDSFSSTFGTSRWNRDRRGSSHFIAKVGSALMRSTRVAPALRSCSVASAMLSNAARTVSR